MKEQTITCPNCGIKIQLTEALTETIREELRRKIEQQTIEKEKQLKEKENALLSKEKSLEEKGADIDEQVQKLLKAEREKVKNEAYAKAREEVLGETKSMKEELAEKTSKLKEAEKLELELRREKRKLEEAREAMQLEVQRKLDEERKQIIVKAREQAAEEERLKSREKDEMIEGLRNEIKKLQRKSETGSQEAQGEALEKDFQELLERTFPFDVFEAVSKGKRGGDIVQQVRNTSGKQCGTILWEMKNTKDFSKSWIGKLKKDRQEQNASVGVILTISLPKEIKNFGIYEDVWVTDYSSAPGLCTALRNELINIERERMVTKHQDSVKDIIYKYVTGQDFSHRVQAIVGTYKKMQEDLETEKRSMTRIWKKRETQIATVLNNMSGMYGEIEGIVGTGKALPGVPFLQLESIHEGDEEEE